MKFGKKMHIGKIKLSMEAKFRFFAFWPFFAVFRNFLVIFEILGGPLFLKKKKIKIPLP